MEWIEFLNDPELNSPAAPHGPPNGEYLSKKVTHDVLECLNTYKECANIVPTLQDELSTEIRLWFIKRLPLVERWISEVIALSKQCEQLPTERIAWPSVITQIGDIVEQVSKLEIESQALDIPATGSGREITHIGVRAIENLNLLRRDIQAREYKRLWITVKYGDSIEG